jgi:ABC-type antimicrobial peptide transport system permease subunit
VFWLIMRQGGTLGLIGAAIGVALAFLSGKVVSSQVYAVRASDPLMLVSAIVLITAITLAATMLPALRAARLSPSSALRSE